MRINWIKLSGPATCRSVDGYRLIDLRSSALSLELRRCGLAQTAHHNNAELSYHSRIVDKSRVKLRSSRVHATGDLCASMRGFVHIGSECNDKSKLVMTAAAATASDNPSPQGRRSAAAPATAPRLASSFRSREVECSMTKSARIAFAASLLAALTATGEPASALVPQANGSLQQQLELRDELITEIRARGGGAVRRTTVTGPRGNTASRTVARSGAVVRPGGWVRPAHYHWRPGGAIAAGAAIGVVAAATAAAWAGSPPAPGYCWYYTDPSRTQGFWDVCP
jgi:hypothetical protein